METPSLSTFVDIFEDTIVTWYNCKPYAITPWAVEFLFYLSLILTLFYFYVISMVIYKRIRKGQFNNPFYNCVIVLSLGDIGTLITCSRATIPTCALRGIAARYLLWESLGVFCVDLIYGVNLVMSSIRLNAVLTNTIKITKTSWKPQSTYFMNIFLAIEFLWASTMAVLYFNGIVRKIWFVGTEYHGEWKSPFELRTSFNMIQLGLTFFVYCMAFIKLRRMKLSMSSFNLNREYRLMILAVLIFFCELFFIYSSDWVGFNWGIGDADFNANVAYFGRPLSAGITPFFYLIFSSEVRRTCFFCCKSKTLNGPPSSIQTVASNFRRHSDHVRGH